MMLLHLHLHLYLMQEAGQVKQHWQPDDRATHADPNQKLGGSKQGKTCTCL